MENKKLIAVILLGAVVCIQIGSLIFGKADLKEENVKPRDAASTKETQKRQKDQIKDSIKEPISKLTYEGFSKFLFLDMEQFQNAFEDYIAIKSTTTFKKVVAGEKIEEVAPAGVVFTFSLDDADVTKIKCTYDTSLKTCYFSHIVPVKDKRKHKQDTINTVDGSEGISIKNASAKIKIKNEIELNDILTSKQMEDLKQELEVFLSANGELRRSFEVCVTDRSQMKQENIELLLVFTSERVDSKNIVVKFDGEHHTFTFELEE